LYVLPEEVEEEEDVEEEDFDVLAEEEDGDEHVIEALFIRCGSVTIEKSKRSVEEKNRRNEQQDCELEKQAIIAYEIEQLHNSKSSASKDRLLARLLQRISEPKMWQSSSGTLVEVETADTERFRTIRLVYESICKASLAEQRTAALILLKKTLWGKSGSSAKELVQLADRELDLLSRGLMTSSLSGLQSRLRALLRHYVIDQLPHQLLSH